MSQEHENPDDVILRAILTKARRIAMVGLSPSAERDSYRVASYLKQHGYEVIPIYPREEEILGARVYRKLQDVPGPVDIVDVFRKSEDVPSVVDELLATPIPTLWLQLGCIHQEAAARASGSGRTVVMDRCMKREHTRLFGE